jgi:hypothetical protein
VEVFQNPSNRVEKVLFPAHTPSAVAKVYVFAKAMTGQDGRTSLRNPLTALPSRDKLGIFDLFSSDILVNIFIILMELVLIPFLHTSLARVVNKQYFK